MLHVVFSVAYYLGM